ncbi:MAG: 7-carboxy-7-deazaguanine synthase QueE, partial [Candidatus Omnitrophica bacterium]|nr:7-carboxy-7-deazaguanine synthase QueE [Candidatus Omnitrophota bacterium]
DEVQLIERIKALIQGCHSVCFTGGEPLVQIEFLERFLPMICKEDIKIFLETNGTLPKELEKVLKYIDVVSMDMKLPSSTGCDEHWKEHKEFLSIAVGLRKDVYVKAIITQETNNLDFLTAVELISDVEKTVPLIIQPEFSQRDDLMQKCQEYLYLASGQLNDVRIIPQVHKLMGWQ